MIIYETIVGSQCHGLNTPNSDIDKRYITKADLRSIISPFKNDDIKVHNTNNEDTESWELRHFISHLCKGNATCYEVINSPLYNINYPLSEKLREFMPLCFDGKKILAAHIGYADAQIKRYLTPPYKTEENQRKRLPKCIVASYRVLTQATQLLQTGNFLCNIKETNEDLYFFLMDIKIRKNFTDKWIEMHKNNIEDQIQSLKMMFDQLPLEIQNKKPDIDKIEDKLCEVYNV